MASLVPVRTWLLQNGIRNVGWDNNSKTILINGKPFLSLSSGLFTIKNSRSYADPEVLSNALKNFFIQYQIKKPTTFGAVLGGSKTIQPTPANPISIQSNVGNGLYLEGVGSEADKILKAKQRQINNLNNNVPSWATKPTNEPGAGEGTEDITEAQSAQPIAEAQKSETIPIEVNQYTEPASSVGATDVGVNNLSNNPFKLQESVQEKTLQSQLNTYDDILKSLQSPSPLADKVNEIWNAKLRSALDSLQQKFNTQMAALKGEKAEVLAAHKGEMEEIQKAIQAARQRSAEDMNARGLYFSGLLTKAYNEIEEKGLELTAKAAAKKAADLENIAAQVAALTANYAIAKDQATNLALTNKALEEMKLLEKNQDKIDQIKMLQAGIQAQLNALKATALEREKLYDIEQQQLAQEEAMKQKQQDFENWLKLQNLNLQYQNADLRNRQEMFKEWLDTQNLSLAQKNQALNEWYKQQLINQGQQRLALSAQQEKDLMDRFMADLKYKYDKLNLDNAYRQASLALKQAAQQTGMNVQGVPSSLGELLNLSPTKMTGLLNMIENMKNKQKVITDPNNPYQTKRVPALSQNVIDSLTNTEGLITTLMNLQKTDIASNPNEVSKILYTLVPKMQNEGDLETFVNKYLTDPTAKVAAYIINAADGNPDKVIYIYNNEKDNIAKLMQRYGTNNQVLLAALLGIPGGR